MGNVAVRVEHLGKRYRIGGPRKQYRRFGDQALDLLHAPLRRAGRLLSGDASGAAELNETIWALKDAEFEIQHGEVVGIVGRNGAGKSTLLKILSGITEPSEGYADIHGRVGSLLEVGTGFHPELTGRENIYLNGAILGMKKSEIDRKFDEIVAFAEIEQFIETPVKHYSSGMYVRLAFAVAAHLEPEILLVDEVLAVGDVAFQRKCLGKMDDVRRQGRTVLFVSHNMGVMQTLCRRGILIQSGAVMHDAGISEVVDSYLRSVEGAETASLATRVDRRGAGKARVIAAEVQAGDGSDMPLKTGQPATFVFQVDRMIPGIDLVFSLHDQLGQPVVRFRSMASGPHDSLQAGAPNRFECSVEELLLLPGRYRLDISLIGDGQVQDSIEAARIVDVDSGDIRGRQVELGKNGRFSIMLPHRWVLPERN